MASFLTTSLGIIFLPLRPWHSNTSSTGLHKRCIQFGVLGSCAVTMRSFLLKDTTYIDLLLNAVGFVFIVEIAEFPWGIKSGRGR